MAEHDFTKDLIAEIFGERPELAFLGHLGKSGLSDNLEAFFRRRTSGFLQRFQQAAGQQLVGGSIPTQTAEDFFGGINFQQEAGKFSPETLGLGTSRFRPSQSFNLLRR